MVHKQLLTSKIEYFEKALGGEREGVQDYSIYREKDDPGAFALLIAFLYREVIPGPNTQLGSAPSSRPKSSSKLRIQSRFHPTLQPSFGATQGEQDAHQHICFLPFFSTFSPEEIRLDDYDHGERYGNELLTARILQKFGASRGNYALLLGLYPFSPARLADLSEPSALAPTAVASTLLDHVVPKLSGSLLSPQPSESGSFFGSSQMNGPPPANRLSGTAFSSLFRPSNTSQNHFGTRSFNPGNIFGTPPSSDVIRPTGTQPQKPATAGAAFAFNAKHAFSQTNPVGSAGRYSGIGDFSESGSRNSPRTGSLFGESDIPSRILPTGQPTKSLAAWRVTLTYLLILAE